MSVSKWARALSLVIVGLVLLAACSKVKPDPETINEPEGILAFELSPTTLEAGQELNLSWKASATSKTGQTLVCSLNAITAVEKTSTAYACEASLTLKPLTDTSYQLVAVQGERNWESKVLKVTVTSPSQNVAPFVNNDEYRLSRSSSLRVTALKGVLANDSDVNGDKLSVKLVEDVRSGTLELSPDGSFVYSNSGTGSSVDYFNYVATDGQLDSVTATVVLNLLEPPATQPDAYTGTAGETLVVSLKEGVLANDGLSVDYVAQLKVKPQFGSLQLNPDGSFSYTPDETIVSADSFSYIANNGEFSSLPTSVTISLNR